MGTVDEGSREVEFAKPQVFFWFRHEVDVLNKRWLGSLVIVLLHRSCFVTQKSFKLTHFNIEPTWLISMDFKTNKLIFGTCWGLKKELNFVFNSTHYFLFCFLLKKRLAYAKDAMLNLLQARECLNMVSIKGKNNMKWPKIGLYKSQIRSSKIGSFRISPKTTGAITWTTVKTSLSSLVKK